jgi:aminopeptidase N
MIYIIMSPEYVLYPNSYFAVTLFWPDNARQIFPCFDEPQMKATFDVTLLRMNNVVALANMNSIGEEDR